MPTSTDIAFPFDLAEEIAVRRKEFDREIAHVRSAEADFDEYGVEGTPYLKEIADRLDDLIALAKTKEQAERGAA